MSVTQCLTDSFIAECLNGTHNLTTDTLKLALYDLNATHGPLTTIYTTDNEISGTGYVAGGMTVTGALVTSGVAAAWCTFDDTEWTDASFSAASGLLYNVTQGNKAIAVIDFGGVLTVTVNSFTIRWPQNDQNNAIIRIVSPR